MEDNDTFFTASTIVEDTNTEDERTAWTESPELYY